MTRQGIARVNESQAQANKCNASKGKARQRQTQRRQIKNTCKTRHCTITKGNAMKGKPGKPMKCNMRQRRLEQIKVKAR